MGDRYRDRWGVGSRFNPQRPFDWPHESLARLQDSLLLQLDVFIYYAPLTWHHHRSVHLLFQSRKSNERSTSFAARRSCWIVTWQSFTKLKPAPSIKQ